MFEEEVQMIAPYNTYHAYSVITPYLTGLNVAHIGFVQRAGLALLAQEAASLIHFDISDAVIPHIPETETCFDVVSAKVDALPCADKSMDVLVCFNNDQHPEEEHALFAEAERILKPHGVFVFLSRNAAHTSKTEPQSQQSATVLKEAQTERAGLEEKLATHFRQQHWLRQKYLSHSVVWPEGENSLFVNVSKFSQGEIKIERNLQHEADCYLVIAHSAKEPCLPLGRLLSAVNILHNDMPQALAAQKEASAATVSDYRYRQLLLAQNAELQTTRYQLSQAQEQAKTLEIEQLHCQAKVQNLEKELEKMRQQLEYNRVDTACILRLREQLQDYREASLEQSEVSLINHSSHATAAKVSLSKVGRLRRWFAN